MRFTQALAPAAVLLSSALAQDGQDPTTTVRLTSTTQVLGGTTTISSARTNTGIGPGTRTGTRTGTPTLVPGSRVSTSASGYGYSTPKPEYDYADDYDNGYDNDSDYDSEYEYDSYESKYGYKSYETPTYKTPVPYETRKVYETQKVHQTHKVYEAPKYETIEESTYVTVITTDYTTYCPAPTSFVHKNVTYKATAETVLTITNCPCTVTRTQKPPKQTYAPPTAPPQAPPKAPPQAPPPKAPEAPPKAPPSAPPSAPPQAPPPKAPEEPTVLPVAGAGNLDIPGLATIAAACMAALAM